MLSGPTLDDLIREQENLRLQSLRHLEQLRMRQDKYRNCRFPGHDLSTHSTGSRSAVSPSTSSSEHAVISGETNTLVDGNKLHYRSVSAAKKLSSYRQSGSSVTGINGSTSQQFSQPPGNGQKHINARQLTSAVLSDDLQCEKWSASATHAAKKKLISGRMHTGRNINNSSSVDTCNGSRVFEPLPTSSKFTDLNGSKAPEIDTNDDGYFLSYDLSGGIGTPPKLEQSLEGTPKSILRHRQIIDKNVHVDSKFDHTPTTNARSRQHRRGLNFSYSDVDDAQLFGHKTKSVNFDVDSKKSATKSNSEAVDLSSQPTESQHETQVKSLTSSSLAGDALPSSQRFYYAPDATDSSENSMDAKGSCAAPKVASEGLLLQTGNDRQNAKIVRELESRSQSGLFSTDQPLVMTASTSQSQVLKNYIHSLVFNFKLVFLKHSF